ncbi:MAG: DUF3368 domain-containing protein [Chloroflexota bacterium]
MAKERSLPLLADDRAARTEAQRQGVAVSGSVGVLLEAKRRRTIPAVRPALDQLRAAGYRLSEREYERGLRRAGEWP